MADTKEQRTQVNTEIEGIADYAPPAARHAAKKQRAAKKPRKKVSAAALGWSIIASLIVGAAIFGGTLYFCAGGALHGQSTLTSAELDMPVACYYYKGLHEVTARQVYEHQGVLEQAQIDDNTYYSPMSNLVVAYVQDQVIVQAGQEDGFTPSQPQVDALSIVTLGYGDPSAYAQANNIGEEEVKQQMAENADIQLFYYNTLAQALADDAPAAPATPSGDQYEANVDYAEYIKNLVSDAWDSATNTWAEPSSEYASMYDKAPFDGSTATYAQALIAYYLAIDERVNSNANASTAWVDMESELFSHIIFISAMLQG